MYACNKYVVQLNFALCYTNISAECKGLTMEIHIPTKMTTRDVNLLRPYIDTQKLVSCYCVQLSQKHFVVHWWKYGWVRKLMNIHDLLRVLVEKVSILVNWQCTPYILMHWMVNIREPDGYSVL